MSLIHWWQLNGDLKDYGTNPITLTNNGATIDNNGKIGKCYSFNGNNTMTASGITIGTDCSFCVWSKTSTIGKMMFGLQASDSDKLNLYNSPEGPICWNTGDAAQNPFKNGDTPISAIIDGAWHHYAVVCKGSDKAHLYIDGVYAGTAIKCVNPSMTNKLFYIANWSAVSGYQWNGQLNDIRIYDHALSLKEVKEISKGLVLDYNFEELTRENFLKTPLVTYSTNTTKTTEGNVAITGLDYTTLPGKTLVFSYDYSVEGAKYYVNTGDIFKDRYGIHGVIQYTINGTSYTSYPFAGYLTVSGTGRAIQKITIPSNWVISSVGLANQTGNKPANGNTNTWYIKNVKLEIVPSSSDTASEFYGTSDNIIRDNSGYGYNGVTKEALTISSESVVGNQSIQFTGDGKQYVACTSFPQFKNGVTMSVWCKQENASSPGTNQFIFSQGRDYQNKGISIVSLNGKAAFWGSFGLKSTSFDLVGAWHMLTGTYDGANVKFYIDGELKFNVASTAELVYDTVPAIVVGKMGHGYNIDDRYFMFNGKVAEAKFYATVLSADDIKLEYQRKASIDKNGNLFSPEFIEDDTNIKITNTQITKARVLQEGNTKVQLFGKYTELEYIENSGTQFIDTGFIPNQDSGIEIKFSSSNYANNKCIVFGSGVSYNSRSFELYTWDGKFQFNYNASQVNLTTNPATNIIIETSQMKQKVVYKDVSDIAATGTQSSQTFTCPYTLYLMALHRATLGVAENMKIYSCRIYDNNTLVRDFIPAKRNSDNVLGLYDIVEHKFYTNSGTGTFTSGPELGQLSLISTNQVKEV